MIRAVLCNGEMHIKEHIIIIIIHEGISGTAQYPSACDILLQGSGPLTHCLQAGYPSVVVSDLLSWPT